MLPDAGTTGRRPRAALLIVVRRLMSGTEYGRRDASGGPEDQMRRLLDEEKLHADAITWLSAERHYKQVFEGSGGINARFDSVGMMNARPCFIEVKTSIGPVEARHIESKISGSLRGHANPSDLRPQFTAMRAIWDGRSTPLIATIARHYTEPGLADLTRILEARSREWVFDYEIWLWTGGRLEVLARNRAGSENVRDPSLLVEEVRIEASPRAPKATLAILRALAAEQGVLELFDHAVEVGPRLGLKLDYRTEHVTLTPRRGTGWLPVLPKRSGRDIGLVLDVAWPIVPHLEGLPLLEHGPGWSSYTRYSVKDAATLTQVLEAASSAFREA